MKRGLTLFELVAALALFGSVLGVCLSWIQFAGRSTSAVVRPMQWHAAAEQVMRRIEEDLRVGDFDPDDDARTLLKARVEDARLLVRTRGAGGEVEHEFGLSTDGVLSRTERPAGARGRGDDPARMLLSEVARFEAQAEPSTQRLAVRIVSREGQAVAGEWTW